MADQEETKDSIFNKLAPKHQAFVLEYMKEKHAATAYRNAYGTGKKTLSNDTCAANGYKLLRNAYIKEAIKEKLNEIWGNRTTDIGRVYDELMALAFSDVRDVMDFHEDGTFNVKDLAGVDTRSIKKLKIRKEPSKKVGDEVVEGADIIEIELYDKRTALSDLSEILKLKDQKGVTVNFFSDEAAKSVLAKHGL